MFKRAVDVVLSEQIMIKIVFSFNSIVMVVSYFEFYYA